MKLRRNHTMSYIAFTGQVPIKIQDNYTAQAYCAIFASIRFLCDYI